MENPDKAPAADAKEIIAPVEGDAAVEQVAEPVAEEPAADVVDAATAEEVPAENVVNGLIDGDTPVPMSHPDGGSCDAYATDGDHLIVPAHDVPAMLDHGFVVAAGDE